MAGAKCCGSMWAYPSVVRMSLWPSISLMNGSGTPRCTIQEAAVWRVMWGRATASPRPFPGLVEMVPERALGDGAAMVAQKVKVGMPHANGLAIQYFTGGGHQEDRACLARLGLARSQLDEAVFRIFVYDARPKCHGVAPELPDLPGPHPGQHPELGKVPEA